MDVCDAPHRLVVTTWEEDGDENEIVATLTEEGDGTRLVVEESGLPLDQYQFHGAGWQAHIEDLGRLLAGRPASDWQARWEELMPAYEAMLR